MRAVERHRGDTTRLMNDCLADLDGARTVGEIRDCRRGFSGRFQRIPVDSARIPPRVLEIELKKEARKILRKETRLEKGNY